MTAYEMNRDERKEFAESIVKRPCYGAKDAGCWVDNCRGIYMGDAIIEIAIDHGWGCDVEGAEGDHWQPSPTWSDHEHYHELTDEAEEFMQQFAEGGFTFCFGEDSMDWGLYPIDEEA